MPSRVLLGMSIAAESAGTLALGVSEGFTRPVASMGCVLGYVTSLWLFARMLDRGGIALGPAYATLTGVGLLVATIASPVVLGETITVQQVAGLLTIAVGVVLIQTAPTKSGQGS